MSSSARQSISSSSRDGGAEQIARIVEAAERAAGEIIDDAERRARQRLEQARVETDRLVEERLASLTRLSDALIAEAEGIRRHADRLLAALQEAREGTDEQPPSSPVTSLTPRLSAVRASAPEAGGSTGLSGARIAATQMAVTGAGRQEIDIRLRTEFGIEDTAAILDAILGPEG